MNIRWKNKNPYINFYREAKKILASDITDKEKEEWLTTICKKDYTGNWLFSHPSHKFLGDKKPTETDDITENPFYSIFQYTSFILSLYALPEYKIDQIYGEFEDTSEIFANERVLDWVYTE